MIWCVYMAEQRNTVGYTESLDYRCLEDLREDRKAIGSSIIGLDYCGRERCKPDYAFGPYIRENYVLHIVIEGKGQLSVKGQTYSIGKNQAFILVPGEETVYRADKEDPWTYAWIGFHGYESEKLVHGMGFYDNNYVIDIEDAGLLGGYIDKILDHSQLTFANYIIRNSYMGLLIGELIKNADIPADENRFSEETYVNMALQHITANYQNPVKIAGIANRIGINRSYLAIIFKKKMGISPQEFLINFRMEKAAELLMETDLAIRAVAAGVGYKDPLTFSKAFKQKYGINPSEFREHPPKLKENGRKGDYTGKHKL